MLLVYIKTKLLKLSSFIGSFGIGSKAKQAKFDHILNLDTLHEPSLNNIIFGPTLLICRPNHYQQTERLLHYVSLKKNMYVIIWSLTHQWSSWNKALEIEAEEF